VLVAVAGASGFVGRGLVPELAAAGHQVRALTRHPQHYPGQGTAVAADVADPASLPAALDGVEVLVYLVHSLDRADFVARDAEAARAVARAAAAAGVRQIIYLGGLGDDADDLSPHLRSRREVEHLLGEGGVPVTVLRAGIVIGAGGASFEMLRDLVRHLPVMVAPRWVSTRTQPVALADVVGYLSASVGCPAALRQTWDVGGAEVLRYSDMLHRTAALMGCRRVVLPVPLLTPRLSSLWLSLVTSVDPTTARSLVDSMTNEVVVRDDAIRRVLPRPLVSFDDAVRAALSRERAGASA